MNLTRWFPNWATKVICNLSDHGQHRGPETSQYSTSPYPLKNKTSYTKLTTVQVRPVLRCSKTRSLPSYMSSRFHLAVINPACWKPSAKDAWLKWPLIFGKHEAISYTKPSLCHLLKAWRNSSLDKFQDTFRSASFSISVSRQRLVMGGLKYKGCWKWLVQTNMETVFSTLLC